MYHLNRRVKTLRTHDLLLIMPFLILTIVLFKELREPSEVINCHVKLALPDLNRVDTLNSDTTGCFRCNRKVCDACHNFLLPSKRIKSVVTGKCYKIRQTLSCCTDYIIYCATCLLCNRQCVGSSVNFRARLSNHKSHIKQKKRTCRLVNHFIDNAHDHPLSSLKFVLIEQVSIKTETFLDIGKPNCGLMNLMVSMLRRSLTQVEDANFLACATIYYLRRFPKFLE